MSYKITLKELNVFHAIEKYKTVQKAATNLFITQSAASQALSKLENSLGSNLFDRYGKQLILNENGRLLLPLARNSLNSIENIENLFFANPLYIKLGASTTIGNYVMPNKLAQIYQQNPSAKLNMMINNTDAIISAVENFEIDIGLIEGPCLNNDIVVTPWIDDELLIFQSIKDSNDAMTSRQLLALPWLLREKGSGTRKIVEQFLLTELGNIKISMELGNSEVILRTVTAGFGISCLSHYVLKDLLEQQKISIINTMLPTLNRKFYILTHKNKALTHGMKVLLNSLK